jgi:hypothetical protein
MALVRSEGGAVKVGGGSLTMTKSLRKGTAATRSEGGVKVAACSGDGDEAVACPGAWIVDDSWQRRRGGF